MGYIHKKSQKQEKRTAKDFGGRTQAGSGSIESVGMKADVRMGERGTTFNEDDFLIENKYTDKDFYSLKYDTWEKIKKEAIRDNMRIPAMQIDIYSDSYILLPKHIAEGVDFGNFTTMKEDIVGKGKSIRLFTEELKGKYSHNLETLSVDVTVFFINFETQGETLVLMDYDDFKLFHL